MKTAQHHNKRPKRTDIQALRAIAVLSVVIYHLWPSSLTGGFMGVDIFFVISGYLMTATILKDVSTVTTASGKLRATAVFLAAFYARRIKRLIPAAAVTLLGILGLVYATGNLSLIAKTADQVLSSAFFVQNWKLAADATDYLAPSEPPTAVQHFWSLSLEEQFYLAWPLLIVIVSLLTSSLFLLYKKTRIPGAVLPLSLLTGGFFVYGFLLTTAQPTAAYFVTPARVWELMIGGILAFLPALRHYDLKLLLPWLGTALIAYSLYKLDGVNFPGWHALIPVLGTSLILYGGSSAIESKISFTHLFKSRPIQWVGDISYSLYLWHWPLIVLLPVLFTVNIEGALGLQMKLCVLALSLLAAWLSYHYIEQPTIKWRPKNRWIYIAFAGVLLAVGSTAFIVSSVAQQKAKDGLQTLHQIALGDSPCFGGRAIAHINDCGDPYGKVNKDWYQFVKTDKSLSLIQDNGRWCDYYRITENTDPGRFCEYGDRSSSTNIVIWGDSHADHWVNAFDDIGRQTKTKFTHFSSGDCAADNITAPACRERIQSLTNTNILQKSNAVIISVVTKDDIARMQNTIKTIRSITNSPVFLVEDVPSAGVNGGPDCFLKGLSCKEPIDSATSLTTNVNDTLVSSGILAQKSIIPTKDMFCHDAFCYSYIGGVSVYRDTSSMGNYVNSHISSVYALSISGLLEQSLRSAGIFDEPLHTAEQNELPVQ